MYKLWNETQTLIAFAQSRVKHTKVCIYLYSYPKEDLAAAVVLYFVGDLSIQGESQEPPFLGLGQRAKTMYSSHPAGLPQLTSRSTRSSSSVQLPYAPGKPQLSYTQVVHSYLTPLPR